MTTPHPDDKAQNGPQPEYYRTTHTVHRLEPDYTRPLFEISPETRESLLDRLTLLYGRDTAARYLPELERVVKVYYATSRWK